MSPYLTSWIFHKHKTEKILERMRRKVDDIDWRMMAMGDDGEWRWEMIGLLLKEREGGQSSHLRRSLSHA